jgi:hypothetical protein
VAAQKRHWNWLVLALSAGASGCILPGGDVDPVLHPGTPVGITALRIPVDRFVIPVPAPAGFSSTYRHNRTRYTLVSITCPLKRPWNMCPTRWWRLFHHRAYVPLR